MSNEVTGRNDPEFREIVNVDDYNAMDLARTHGMTRSEAAAAVDPALVDAQHRTLLEQGFVIIEDLVPRSLLDELREAAGSHLTSVGRNSFEGERTQRIYGLPEKIRAADAFITHPLILAHLD